MLEKGERLESNAGGLGCQEFRDHLGLNFPRF